MTSVLPPPAIKMKSFSYHTSVTEVEGRTASLRSDGKPALRVASPPEFKGVDGLWTPEDLFVAAIEVCLMLTFVGVAAKRGLLFESYESRAEGTLEWDQQSYRFTRVVVTPSVRLPNGHSVALAEEVMQRAHDTCLVAKSVSCDVLVRPVFETAT